MFKRYLNKSILIDLIICILVGIGLYFFKERIKNYFAVPTRESINGFCSLLITSGTTFIGFFLTVITVLVTFKNAFDSQPSTVCKYEENEIQQKTDENADITNTVFDKKVSKEKQFYGSNIYPNVLKVYLHATYEIGIALLFLLLIQSYLFKISFFWFLLITILCFTVLVLAVIRSLYIFRLFLNVHGKS